MEPGTIVWEGRSRQGKNIVIRSLQQNDAEALCRYMNALSEERLSDFKGNSSHWRKRRLTLPANYSACSRTKRFSWWPCARGRSLGWQT